MKVQSASRRPPQARRLLPTLLGACLTSPLLSGPCAQAAGLASGTLPTGLQVVQGQASSSVQGAQLTVRNSANAILSWQSFSIGAGASVYFDQPSAGSKVLNRVTGNDPTSIFGSLGSNGQVWLLNPNGVLFGAGSRVDVAGLVASTLPLKDSDFLLGRTPWADMQGAATLRNEGQLSAPGGQIVLLGGQVLNLGGISAQQVDLHAAVLNQSGIVRAQSQSVDAQGRIVLSGEQALSTGAQSQTLADGPGGGQITIQAGAQGTALVQGLVSAQGLQGPGGRIELLGQHVGVLAQADVNASGSGAGGAVFVGGGARGQDASLPNAQAVYVAPTALVQADATASGDGGHIVLWSDSATRAYGSFSARGGPLGGNGGLIETSGGWLDARPAGLSVTAAKGRAGSWLLDPNDITISDSVTDSMVTGNPSFTTMGDSATLSTATVVGALNAGNNVYISTGSSPNSLQNGDIHLAGANLQVSAANPGSFNLYAARNITMDASSISSANAPLALNFLSDFGAAVGSASSAVGTIEITNSTIRSHGGDVQLTGNKQGSGALVTNPSSSAIGYDDPCKCHGSGVLISNSTIDVGTGSFLASGFSLATQTDAMGVSIVNSTIAGGSITLLGWVESPGGLKGPSMVAPAEGQFTNRIGVSIAGATLSSPSSLTITGTAISDAFHTDTEVLGVEISGGAAGAPTVINMGSGAASTPVATVQGAAVEQAPSLASTPMNGRASVTMSGANVNLSGSSSFLVADANPGVTGIFRDQISLSESSFTALSGPSSIQLSGNDGQTVFTLAGLSFTGPQVTVRIGGGAEVDILAGAASDTSFLKTTGTGQIDIRSSMIKVMGPSLGLTDISSDYVLTLEAQNIYFDAAYHIASSSNIYLSGLAGVGSGLQSFTLNPNAAGPVFSVPNGQALIALASGVSLPSSWTNYDFSAFAPGLNFTAGAAGNPSNVLQTPLVAAGKYYMPSTGVGVLYDAAGTLLSFIPSTAGPVSKVYDGGTYAYALTPANLPGGYTGGTLTAGFADANVGQGKPILLPAALQSGVLDAVSAPFTVLDLHQKPVYGFRVLSGSTSQWATSGAITPASLTVSGTAVNSKTYDGTTAANVHGGQLVGLVEGDVVSLSQGGSFVTRNVGTAVAVGVQDTISGPAAGNYLLVQPSGLSAAITPAVLSYVASPALRPQGGGGLGLTGSVSGFVAGDTLATATSGSLLFSSSVDASSPPGRYPIIGSGLSAQNYVFQQSPGNAVALTLVPTPAVPQAISNVQDMLPTAQAFASAVARSLDASASVATSPAGARTLNGLAIDDLGPGAVDAILAARELYLRSVFSRGEGKLAVDPQLADVRECETLEQAKAGVCIVTTAFKTRQAAIQAAAGDVPGAVDSEAQAAGKAVSPTEAQRPRQAESFFAKRRPVKTAALARIQRKLAVVIGIDGYADKDIPRLRNAKSDAQGLGTLLAEKLGYETLVLPDARKSDILAALNDLALAAGASDSVIVYFAGHGRVVESTGQGYWIPSDAAVDAPQTWIANTDIGKLLGQIAGHQVLLIADSCFSGKLATDERIQSSTLARDPDVLLQHRTAIAMTSGNNTPVSDLGKEGHSLFTWELLDKINALTSWRAGSLVFDELRYDVARKLSQRPRYGPAQLAGHDKGGDYLFEVRQLGAREP